MLTPRRIWLSGRSDARRPRRAHVAAPGGYLVSVGSSGQKPRKQHDHQHLPKVGTKPNRDFELREKRKVDFGGWPIAIVAVLVLLLAVAVIAIT